MYYTYILISEDGKHTYTGCTKNVERRLSEHNLGKNKSSKYYAPYTVLYVDDFQLLVEARRKEKFYKTTSGRRILKKLVSDWKSIAKK